MQWNFLPSFFGRWYLVIGFIIGMHGLTGCRFAWLNFNQEKSYVVKELPLGAKCIPWNTRCKQLRGFNQFTINGHVIVRSPTHQEVHLIFECQQSFNGYVLKLSNTDGKLIATLKKEGKQAYLIKQEQIYQSEHAEWLLQKHMGCLMPVSALLEWVKGVPQSKSCHEKVFNQQKQLLTLQQNGWFIRYLRYHKIKKKELPTQLCLMKDGWYLRILLSHWKL